eukprot:310898_1
MERKSCKIFKEMETEQQIGDNQFIQHTHHVFTHFFKSLLQKQFLNEQQLNRSAVANAIKKYVYDLYDQQFNPFYSEIKKYVHARQPMTIPDKMVKLYEDIFKSIDFLEYITTQDIKQCIKRNVKSQKKRILMQFQRESIQKQLVSTVLNELIIEIASFTKQQFCSAFIKRTLSTYPPLHDAAEQWFTKSLTFNINGMCPSYLNEILLEVYPLHLFSREVETVESDYTQIITDIMENVMLSKTKQYADLLWMDDIAEQKTESVGVSLLKEDEKACQQITSWIISLFNNLGYEHRIENTNFVSILFIELLKAKNKRLRAIMKSLPILLQQYFKILSGISLNVNSDATLKCCDEHKEYRNECNKCKGFLYAKEFPTGSKNVLNYLSNNVKICTNLHVVDHVQKDVLIIYKHIFEINCNLKAADVKGIINKCANEMEGMLKLHGSIDAYAKLEMFYNLVLAGCRKAMNENQFLYNSELSKSPKLFKDIDQWFQHKITPQLKACDDDYSMSRSQISNMMQNIFSDDLQKKLKIEKLKANYIEFIIQIIKEKCYLSRKMFIESETAIRSMPFIEQTKAKIEMKSVKKMKAIWYQGINKNHKILPDQTIQKSHVLACVLYTQCSELCTAFRETYRKKFDEELMVNQIRRHSEFANFGRLLYESFVFYGSVDYQVDV